MAEKTPDEFALINEIQNSVGPTSERVVCGIGDDTAILKPSKHPYLICTDAMVEGVHFDLNISSAEDVGHKALASCLSDIAAMNGTPLTALFSIALPREPREKAESFLTSFYKTASHLARTYGVDIVGGDLTSSPGPIFIDVVCTGQAAHPKKRSGAKPGDWIAISGHPGASAAGLYALQHGLSSPATASLVHAHLRPMPRFDLLPALNKRIDLCTALIDVSDGLSSEIHHIAMQSNVGCELDSRLIPLHPEAKALAQTVNQNALHWALSGGEDYELLAILDPTALSDLGTPPAGFTLIGRITDQSQGLTIVQPNGTTTPLPATGYNHFKG